MSNFKLNLYNSFFDLQHLLSTSTSYQFSISSQPQILSSIACSVADWLFSAPQFLEADGNWEIDQEEQRRGFNSSSKSQYASLYG